MDFKHAVKTITSFISSEIERRNSDGVVIGLSGGLDSSVAAVLAVKALGPRKVFGLILPEAGITASQDITDAKRLAKYLKIKYKVIEIGRGKKQFLKSLPKDKMAQANLAPRLRMCIIYYYAGIMNRLALGTSDRSELELGYYTKYGDGASDIMPIGDVYKTELRKLARYLRIPFKIADKESSPALWKGQTAEGEIGVTYEEIDAILRSMSMGSWSYSTLAHIKPESVKKVVALVEKNSHKKEMPPVCKVDHS